MIFTSNNFKKICDYSSEKLFHRITEAIATSDNAALVSMYDDTLIVLDEETNNLYLCDYNMSEDYILEMSNFQPIQLVENDGEYFDQVVEDYFDVQNDNKVTVDDLYDGFKLKFKDESEGIIREAKDNKNRRIQENSRIRAIKKARLARNIFEDEIRVLLEEPFIKHMTVKSETRPDNIPSSLNKVNFTFDSGEIKVNTDPGKPSDDMITLKDNTNVMDAMKNVASKISNKWKSDAFRKRFEEMMDKILATESIEYGKNSVINFLKENKELFLLKKNLFEELITKTSLMYGETDVDNVLGSFNKIMSLRECKEMKKDFLAKNSITEEDVENINNKIEDNDVADMDSDKKDSDKLKSPDDKTSIDSEDLKKIVSILGKIKNQLDDDSMENSYVTNLISSLEGIEIDNSKMKEVIDFLSSVETKKDDDEELVKKESPGGK